MKVSVTGVAIIAACLALILTGYSAFHDKNKMIATPNNNTTANNKSSQGDINYEDEEF